MKKIIYTLAFMLVGIVAFGSNNENIDNNKSEVTSYNQIEFTIDLEYVINKSNIDIKEKKDLSFFDSSEIEIQENVNGRCRWRICTYRNGVRVGCTPWEYGECLDVVTIEASSGLN